MPEEEFKKFIPEEEPKKEKGRNVRITISVSRHAEKTSEGEISETGFQDSVGKGKGEKLAKGGIKSYVSPFKRAFETSEAELEGIKDQDKQQKIFRTREKIELAPPQWKHMDEIFPKAKKIEEEEGEDGLFRYILAEPLAQEDLESWTSGLTFLIDRHRRMASKLETGFEVKLNYTTHDMVIGDFLRKVAILKDEEGKRVELGNLDNISGPIKYLEGFDLEIYLDNEGREHLKIIFRGKEFEVDTEKFDSLVNLYKQKPYKGRLDKQDWKGGNK